jgi:hypothetical protein
LDGKILSSMRTEKSFDKRNEQQISGIQKMRRKRSGQSMNIDYIARMWRSPVLMIIKALKRAHYRMIAAAPMAIPPTIPATIIALGSPPELAVELLEVDLAEGVEDFDGGGVMLALGDVGFAVF